MNDQSTPPPDHDSLRDFINDSRSTGILLIGCTLVSLFISNSGGSWYTSGWKAESHTLASGHLPSSPLEWINNFLMAFSSCLQAWK
ncbi:Na+/H+ antiporter NhaA [Puia sp. P3]|uniref:Na+/H+ antiporter NhaA n=1 Tax=Puia sp. P3 TaxID=3423952 RepID=UPI003D67CFA8